MRAWVYGTIAAGLLGLVGGCDTSHTETGYSPHRLGMNGSQLRALYAPAFTPEARATEIDRTPDINHR